MTSVLPGLPMRGTPPGAVMRTEHDDLQHLIQCPCGCGTVYHARHAVARGSVETRDLTLTPSLVMGGVFADGTAWGCGWHGWLTDGEFNAVEEHP